MEGYYENTKQILRFCKKKKDFNDFSCFLFKLTSKVLDSER